MNRNLRPSSKGTSKSVLNSSLISKQYDGKIAGLYDLEETLGRGHFAVVKLARHVFTGEKVAVKVIDKTKLDEVSKAHLFQEVRCMKLVQHPNVVRLYEVIDTATKLYLVLELGDGGDLYEYIMRHESGLPEKVAKEYFTQIVRAISYCHQLHVVHRDLKPENVVFFKKQGVVKLTDFGFSNKFYPGQKLETSCGSLAYSAPEILLGDSYDAPAVDVWSLGVILYMLVCGQPPFQEANDSETLTMIMDCKYEIPSHVSQNCRKLISRMLLRNPEKRATLMEIAGHSWLNTAKQDVPDLLPLVSKEHLSEEDHNVIVQKIVNGNIATKEEIQESLEKNEYNHVTATYYLLAERKLRYKRQEICSKNKRPEELSVFAGDQSLKQDSSAAMKPTLLSVPRTPGDIPQRSRKCSIVQEDEEEEDISSCSTREDLGPPLNRRGSRSEGRLNFTLQERLAESEKRKSVDKKHISTMKKVGEHPKPNMEHNTIIPIITTETDKETAQTNTNIHVNEFFSSPNVTTDGPTSRFHRPYEQKKSRFHKNRTASCSSSDASDDDSEKRKKRAQKLTTPSKSFEVRRDSHDDSSDSQEPGTGAGSSGINSFSGATVTLHTTTRSTEPRDYKERNGNDNSNERKNSNMTFGKNHKNIRKRNGSTRLRESQSLNRITEVQEDVSQIIMIPTGGISNNQNAIKPKSVGSKILQGLNRSSKKHTEEKCLKLNEKLRISRRDTVNAYKNSLDKTDNCNKLEKCGIRKIRMLGKYFHVHKKLCIPLAGLFGRSGLYRAQSCSSLTKDKILVASHRPRGLSMIRGEDINQNELTKGRDGATVIDINRVCNELTEICAVHLHIGPTSKCCSFC